MTTSEAIKHFGSSKDLARALGIDPSAVRHWSSYPPIGRQAQLQVITAGKLRAEPFGGGSRIDSHNAVRRLWPHRRDL